MHQLSTQAHLRHKHYTYELQLYINALSTYKDGLKGQSHEIFHLNFSSWNTSA